jgi:protein SCO1/2
MKLVWFIVAILASLSPVQAQLGLPPLLRNVAIEQRLNQQVPLDLAFRDEAGKNVQLGEYFHDKPVILSLVYYDCPMLCTLVLNGLVRALRVLSLSAGKQFTAVTVSFDPRETSTLAAAKRREYLDRYRRAGADAGWHFLTGDEPSIQALTRAVGFRYTFDPKTRQWAHASGIMVLTPKGRLARYFYGVEYSARDLRLALVEASANKIGSPADQFLLFCFHYDPATTKYGLTIMNLIRVAGAATAFGVAALLFVMFRRDWRAHG